MLRPLLCALPFLFAAEPILAEATPRGGPKDIRIRYASYDSQQVFRIETDLRHATTLHFDAGERFDAVIVGDTESFQVDPLPELGNVLTIKPHVSKASTNMTVITNRRTYSFHLHEGSIPGRTGMFFDVRFRYPDAISRGQPKAKAFAGPKNYGYQATGNGDFRPAAIYDDGRFTYFTFPENSRQPVIFKADSQGRERTVNWTQQGNIVRIAGINKFWTLRLGDEAICIYRDTSRISARN
nr:TrbG/VirB9 family P-type conjugative transfer protein [Cognatishimia sp. MH4019]